MKQYNNLFFIVKLVHGYIGTLIKTVWKISEKKAICWGN